MCIRVPPDTTAPAKEITEALLAAIWNEQAPLRGPMWDCTGQPVAVVYRGRWSGGSGPDFEGAMLALGDGGGSHLMRGDVEMHLRCGDWYAHGHDGDPRYNNVALHVVLWPLGAKCVTRADGASVPTLVLADYISLPTAALLEKVAPLVPRLGTLSDEPCWQRTEGWAVSRLVEIVEAAGDARLQSKAAAIEADMHAAPSPDEVFYRGLMDAFGYSANREPMRALAQALPLDALSGLPLGGSVDERAMLLEAVLLGAAGLLPMQREEVVAGGWADEEYAGEVEALWQANAPLLGLPLERGAVSGWATERTRPANAPARRLAAAARLLARLAPARDGIMGPFLRAADTLSSEELCGEWAGLLLVPGEGYWAGHSDFGAALRGAPVEEIALLGEGRAADIVVNVVLPAMLAYADMHGRPSLRDKTWEVYRAYPKLAENKITRAMAEEVFGPRKRGAIKGARAQQGLIHLYRQHCEARRCHECPVSGVSARTGVGAKI